MGVQTRATLQPSRVVRATDLREGAIRRVRLSLDWEMPRAFDDTSPHDHYGKLYRDLAPAALKAKIAQIAQFHKHEAVTPRLRDGVRRVAVSSLPTAGKGTADWKGAPATFGVCERPCCKGHARGETLEHAASWACVRPTRTLWARRR